MGIGLRKERVFYRFIKLPPVCQGSYPRNGCAGTWKAPIPARLVTGWGYPKYYLINVIPVR